jgi:uncharacterized protein YecA (UPF0149 family)
LLTDACEEIAAANPSLDAATVQVRAFDHLLKTSNTLPTLMRYETKFERQYDRAFRGWVTYQEKQGRRDAREVARDAPLPTERVPSQPFAGLPIEIQERLNRLTGLPMPPPPVTESPASLNLPSEPNPTVPAIARIARNASCPCGSGKKYKRCCGSNTPSTTP